MNVHQKSVENIVKRPYTWLAGDIFAAVMSAPHRCLLFDILQGPYPQSGEEHFGSSVFRNS